MTAMESPYAPPASPVGELPQPPSAKSSKIFGILGICINQILFTSHVIGEHQCSIVWCLTDKYER